MEKDFMQTTCAEFAATLASKEPVPGGGGASAYVGALGVALGSMVGNLTLGKPKYADVQEDISALLERSNALCLRLQELVTEDAVSFAPLARAYGLPETTEEEKNEKERTLEAALKTACATPLEIMRTSCHAIDLAEEYAQKGSKLALSDAGVAAVFSKAALLGASLNVFINTKLMTDRAYAKTQNSEAEQMIAEYGEKADLIFERVRAAL